MDADELAIAERMIAWSCSLASRMANTVEHCDRMVGSSSPGSRADDAEIAAVFAAFLGDTRHSVLG